THQGEQRMKRVRTMLGTLLSLLMLASNSGLMADADKLMDGTTTDDAPSAVVDAKPSTDAAPASPSDEETDTPAGLDGPEDPPVSEPAGPEPTVAENVPSEPDAVENPATGPPATDDEATRHVPDPAPANTESREIEDVQEAKEPAASESVAPNMTNDEDTGEPESVEEEQVVTAQAVLQDVTITVMDGGTDTPISGASVVVTNLDTSTVAASGTTGPAGTFVAENLEPAYYTITTNAPGFFEGEAGIYLFGDGTDDLATTVFMNRNTSGVLTLTVLDQNTDAPIPDVSVVVSNVDSVVLQRGSTNAAGVFVSQELPGGVAYLRLSAPGYDTREYGVYIEGNVAESVTLMPLISGTLTITVTD